MAKKKRYCLQINSCIVLSDAKRLQKGLPLFKSKVGLAKYIHLNSLFKGSETSILTKLYRYEDNGFLNEDTQLTDCLIELLQVNRKKLVVEKC